MTFPKLLEHERRSVQVNCEDRRRGGLAGRDTRGVNKAGDVSKRGGCLDEGVNRFAQGHVDGCGAHVESGVAHHLGRSVGVPRV